MYRVWKKKQSEKCESGWRLREDEASRKNEEAGGREAAAGF